MNIFIILLLKDIKSTVLGGVLWEIVLPPLGMMITKRDSSDSYWKTSSNGIEVFFMAQIG
jgi:hypothetical protein